MTENVELATDLKQYEGSVEDHPNPHQHHHNAVVSEWNGVESGIYFHMDTIQDHHRSYKYLTLHHVIQCKY